MAGRICPLSRLPKLSDRPKQPMVGDSPDVHSNWYIHQSYYEVQEKDLEMSDYDKRVKMLMAEWDTLRFGLSEHDAAEAWAESMADHEAVCTYINECNSCSGQTKKCSYSFTSIKRFSMEAVLRAAS